MFPKFGMYFTLKRHLHGDIKFASEILEPHSKFFLAYKTSDNLSLVFLELTTT